MEFVVVKRVVHCRLLSVGPGDAYLLQRNNLVRRNSIGRPVPIRLAKSRCCLNPCILVRSGIGSGNFLSVPVEDLLRAKNAYEKGTIAYIFARSPRTGGHRACAKLGTERIRECNIHPIGYSGRTADHQ
jgi:hypothetical protein